MNGTLSVRTLEKILVAADVSDREGYTHSAPLSPSCCDKFVNVLKVNVVVVSRLLQTRLACNFWRLVQRMRPMLSKVRHSGTGPRQSWPRMAFDGRPTTSSLIKISDPLARDTRKFFPVSCRVNLKLATTLGKMNE